MQHCTRYHNGSENYGQTWKFQRLLTDSGFVDFWDYFGHFSLEFAGAISVYSSRKLERKVAQKGRFSSPFHDRLLPMRQPLIAYWDIENQPLSLGNLLTFRQELEMLSKMRSASHILIYFSDNRYLKVPHLQEILSSETPIETAIKTAPLLEINWPSVDPEVQKWSYGSLKRVFLLHKISQNFPVLRWPSKIIQEAQRQKQIWKNGFQRLIAVHLKQQSSLREESNAATVEWNQFFSSHPSTRFVLLGKDPIDPSISQLEHVICAEKEKTPLSVQLALCAEADGFLGMASGICSAAIFSHTPYVIFKHPEHHPDEMKEELIDECHFPFSKPHQQLWRCLDQADQIEKALGMIKDGG